MKILHPFWTRWLITASLGVIGFGLCLVVAPGLTRQAFSLMVYQDVQAIDALGTETSRYVGLAHAVMGSLMVGLGVAFLLATRELLAKGNPVGWRIIAGTLAAWYVPDTSYSLLSGYWQNAVLNTVFVVLFLPPLWATRPSGRQ